MKDSVEVLDEPLAVETDQRHIMGCSSFIEGKWQLDKFRGLDTEPQASCCSQNLSPGRHVDFKLRAWDQQSPSPSSGSSSCVTINLDYHIITTQPIELCDFLQ